MSAQTPPVQAHSSAFAGTLTALVTPMRADGSCDFAALDALVDAQLDANIDGLVVCGSTGEAATLREHERHEVLRRVVERVAARPVNARQRRRCQVIFGSGAQATDATIEAQQHAERIGADATLVVTPFYVRPSPEGLRQHFEAVAHAARKPILLYNVPSRTGCDMDPTLVASLAKLPNVVGIKEATGILDRFTFLRQQTGRDFVLLTGDDASACAACLMGADGVISVASNLVPDAMGRLIASARRGNVAEARAMHETLRPLFEVLSIESNPLPIKTALAMAGTVQEQFRLPLCPLVPDNRRRLHAVLQAGGWLGAH